MQLAGSRFTDATAVLGNDLATLPNFPAEIRAPAGTLAGVSAFQIHFASRDILTPGDAPNVLVAMNPAALKANLAELERGATIIVNEDAFSKRNLEKAGYDSNPLEDGSLSDYRVHRIPMTALTVARGRGDRGRLDARRRPGQEPVRARRALVAVRTPDRGHRALDRAEVRAAARPVMQANLAAFNAGWSFGETTELLDVQYRVKPATDVAARDLPQRQRDHRAGARADRGERPQPAAAGARELPDHPGLRAPARALAPRQLRRHDDPGRGRDRGRRHGARRRVRRAPRA